MSIWKKMFGDHINLRDEPTSLTLINVIECYNILLQYHAITFYYNINLASKFMSLYL